MGWGWFFFLRGQVIRHKEMGLNSVGEVWFGYLEEFIHCWGGLSLKLAVQVEICKRGGDLVFRDVVYW